MHGLIESLTQAKANLDAARIRGMGIAVAADRLRSTLMNNVDGILAGLRKVEELAEEVAALDAALQKADAELRELRKPKGKASKEA